MTTTHDHGTDDPELLARARAGDTAAVAVLFERYHPVALSLAGRRAGADLAGDIAASAFERILRLLRDGRGPTTAMRPYLAAAVNSAWVDHVRGDSRTVPVADDELDPLIEPRPDGFEQRFEASVVTDAFARLPSRWQHVLWHTNVEGMNHEDVGQVLGLTANAVGVLAHRAREGLRTAYLDAHVQAAVDEDCAATVRALGAYARGTMARSRRQKVEQHLERCARCSDTSTELAQISANLGALLLPLLPAFAAVGGATGSGGDTSTPAQEPARGGGQPRTRSARRALAVAAAVAAAALVGASLVAAGRDGTASTPSTPDAAIPATPGAPEAGGPDGRDDQEPVAPPAEATGPVAVGDAPGAPAPTPAEAPAAPPSTGRAGPTAPAVDDEAGPADPPGPVAPAVDPSENPRLERALLTTGASPAGPGWTRLTLPVTAASPATSVRATIRGASEVCLVGDDDAPPLCSQEARSGWSVDDVDRGSGTVVLDVRHDALVWVGLTLVAPDRPHDDPADNDLDALLRGGG